MTKILVAVDGSPASQAAVRHALRLVSQGLDAAFVLVNVQEPASLYELVVVHDRERLEDVRREAGADLLARAEALLDAAGVRYESEVAGGEPHSTLVELTENYRCDAIFIGARGDDGDTERDVLGSVALAVLQRSPVPVTVVRPAAADPAAGTAAADPADPPEPPEPAERTEP